MRAWFRVAFQSDHDLLVEEAGAKECLDMSPGKMVVCFGMVDEVQILSIAEAAGKDPKPPVTQMQVIQPLQVRVDRDGWKVLSHRGTTYVLCTAHAEHGAARIAELEKLGQ